MLLSVMTTPSSPESLDEEHAVTISNEQRPASAGPCMRVMANRRAAPDGS
jgi:hypothetical protein